MEAFDFKEEPQQVRWLVEDFIRKNCLGGNIGQSNSGKTFFTTGLATAITHGKPFLGMSTAVGNVLIIDEDTPTEVIKERLRVFNAFYNTEAEGKVYLESMQGLLLKDNSLIKTICEYRDKHQVSLVVIDCLSNVCAGMDMNRQSDMGRLKTLKQQCLTPDLAILLNHHISEHTMLSTDEAMTMQPNSLAMYSSAINQNLDSYYVLANPSQQLLETMYVRPISKRYAIKTRPFVCHLAESSSPRTMCFNSPEPYQLEDETLLLPEIDRDILDLFKEVQDYLGVDDIYSGMHKLYGMNACMTSAKRLVRMGKIRLEKGKANLFKFYPIDVKESETK